MKQILLAAAFILSAICSSHCQGVKIGIAGAFSTTLLINSNVSSGNEAIDFKTTFGGQGGFNITYDMQQTAGLSMGILYTVHNQKYSILGNANSVKTSLKYLDIPLLLRAGRMDQGAYVEVGPQIGFLTSASEDFTATTLGYISYSGRNVESQFNSIDLAAVAGVGGTFDAAVDVTVTIGLRFGYSFSDATKQFSESALNSSQKDGTSSYASLAAHYKTGSTLDYQPTHRAFAGIFVTAMYALN